MVDNYGAALDSTFGLITAFAVIYTLKVTTFLNWVVRNIDLTRYPADHLSSTNTKYAHIASVLLFFAFIILIESVIMSSKLLISKNLETKSCTRSVSILSTTTLILIPWADHCA